MCVPALTGVPRQPGWHGHFQALSRTMGSKILLGTRLRWCSKTTHSTGKTAEQPFLMFFWYDNHQGAVGMCSAEGDQALQCQASVRA